MGVGAGFYMCDVVKKSSRSLSHLLMSSCLASVTLKLNVTGNLRANFGRSDVFVFQSSRPEKRTSSCPQRNLFSSETKITRNSYKHFAKELRRQRGEPVRQIINTTRDLKFVLEAEAAAADLSLYGNVGRARA